MTTVSLAFLFAAVSPARTPRVDLVNSARVVRYDGDSAESIQVHGLERALDGYDAWIGPDGQYMIGVEWDEPRDLAEVNIEFRHAIANREEIRVQYWHQNWPSTQKGGWAAIDDPFHGKWVTAKADWWAGDRDVSFSFVPYKEEQPGKDAPDFKYRRTFRLRFLLGKAELPPVRYLHAYGPSKTEQSGFDFALGPKSGFHAPLDISVVNGDIIEDSEGKPTATRSSQIESAAPVQIRYAAGDLETPTRTVVTVRQAGHSEHGFSFLPAEVAKDGSVQIPSLDVTVNLHDRPAPATPAAGQTTYYDRIAKEPEQTWERARREIPALQKTRQTREPLYLPLGPPAARQEIAVSYDGSIYLEKSALKVPAADTDKLKWPADRWYIKLRSGERFDQAAEGAVKQRLLDGYLPIIINEWDAEGVHYEQTSVATYVNGEPADPKGDEPVVLLSKIDLKTQSTVAVPFSIRFQLDVPEKLQLHEFDVFAHGIQKGDKLESYPNPLYRYAFAAGRRTADNSPGDVRFSMKPDGQLAIADMIKTGEVVTVFLSVPFVTPITPEEIQKVRSLQIDKVIPVEVDRWRKLIGAQASIEVPSPLLNDFYRANLAHILITGDRDPFNGTSVLPAATFKYMVCLNEACHQIRSLEMRGLHDEARKYLDTIVAGQSSMGMHGRFTQKKGVLHGLPSRDGNYQTFSYNLDHGFALWMLAEHYQFTRDRIWLEKVSDAMVAACDFVTRERKGVPAEGNTLGLDDEYWGQGLLPPGHLEDPPEWLWWFTVNAYAYRGMRATVEVLQEIHHPQAGRLAADTEEFATKLRRSCQESIIRSPVMKHSDGTWWPFQPTRSRLRGRDVGWIRDALYGPVHLIDCGVFDPNSPEADWILRDAEDNVYLDDSRGRHLDAPDHWFSWGGITIQSNLVPSPTVYLKRNQPKYAIRAFWNSLAANVYEDVKAFCEHPVDRYGEGHGPFYKTPDESAFIVWLRSLLILENGHDLELLAGAPEEWFAPGRQIHVKGAATWFGPMDLDVESNASEVTVRLAPPARNMPREIHIHSRRSGAVREVTINGQRSEHYDVRTQSLAVKPGKDPVVVVFKY